MWHIKRARRVMLGAIFAAMIMLISLVGGNPAKAAQSPLASHAIPALSAVPAASTAACSFQWPNNLNPCSSQEPAVEIESLSEGDTSSCSFAGTVTWGDGSEQDFSFNGGPDGTVFDVADYTYKKAGTYSIAVSDEVVSGPCTWGDFTVSFTYQTNPCTHDYRTAVTERAGTDNDRELFTDTVTFSWCAGSGVQVTSSGQVAEVKKPGFGSLSGLHYKLLKIAGITFWATPASAPEPVIDNEPASASVTASGLTYDQEFDLGSDLADLLTTVLTDGLARPLVPLIRSGKLGALSIKLLHEWGTVVAKFDAFAAKHFGLPNWAANYLANLPIGKIKDAVAGLAGSFVSTLTQSLAALGHNATLAAVVSTLQAGIQQISAALDFITPLWQPRITVTVTADSALAPAVSDEGTQTAFGTYVEEPVIKTTPSS
jgi:hypothetical protein